MTLSFPNGEASAERFCFPVTRGLSRPGGLFYVLHDAREARVGKSLASVFDINAGEIGVARGVVNGLEHRGPSWVGRFEFVRKMKGTPPMFFEERASYFF